MSGPNSLKYARNLAKLGKRVDRSEWVMNPQTVNAVNLPAMNALNFPAAICSRRSSILTGRSVPTTVPRERSLVMNQSQLR